jgi:hypothetical protein
MLPSSANSSLAPYFRLKGNTNVPVFLSADLAIQAVNSTWLGGEISFEIKMCNTTHYVFSASPAAKQSLMQDIGFGPALGLTWGFTGKSETDDLKKRLIFGKRGTPWCVCDDEWWRWNVQNVGI